MNARKILISGLGISGPTLAHWLGRFGFEAVIVEEAPAFRAGGYIVDFWGAGFEVARRMGIVPQLMAEGYSARDVKLVDSRGRRVGGFSADALRRATGGDYVSLPRGALSAALYATIARDVEVIWGDSVAALETRVAGVTVAFRESPPRDFDLVIGADGLHSNVRRLCFAGETGFETRLGYNVAAFEAAQYRPRDEGAYVCYTQPGMEVSRFAVRNDRTMFLFIFRDESDGDALPDGVDEQKAALRRRFESAGWECRGIMQAMESCDAIYFDRVCQVRMDAWARDRIALVGDACFCPSLLSGEGAALSMVGAYVLAGELHRANGDYRQAFARYQATLRPFLAAKQQAALGLASSFVPPTRLAMILRNLVTRAFVIPAIRDAVLGANLKDDFTLPDYVGAAPTPPR